VSTSVSRAINCLYVVVTVHLGAAVLLIAHRDVINHAIAAAHPAWPAARAASVATSLFSSSLAVHVLLAVVLLIRGRSLRSGRARTRVFVTALLVLQLAAHATIRTQLDMLPGYAGWLLAVQGFSLIFEIATLWLLWGTPDGRAYFRPAAPTVTAPAGR
jgi:hypothetical protein